MVVVAEDAWLGDDLPLLHQLQDISSAWVHCGVCLQDHKAKLKFEMMGQGQPSTAIFQIGENLAWGQALSTRQLIAGDLWAKQAVTH